MDRLLSPLKQVVETPGVVVDNPIFQLHYRATVTLLLAFSLLVTARQYIGDPIDCLPVERVPEKLLDTFCWIHSTYSIEESWGKKVGVQVPYPGIDRYTPDKTRIYHKYYQWVCFVLFIQALMFYLPRFAWKSCENSRIKTILLDLDRGILCEEKLEANRNLLVSYIVARFFCNNRYFFAYFLCEVLNLVNVVGQMYLMDSFLGGEFSTYGVQVVEFTDWVPEIRFDPMVKVFPRVTKCSFHGYGPSGDVHNYDSLCILPVNALNEKIYIFLWFWFIIVALLSLAVVFYRVLLILWSPLRKIAMRSRATMTNAVLLSFVVKKCKIGDWFLLYLLCKNMDSVNFGELIKDLSIKLGIEGKSSEL